MNLGFGQPGDSTLASMSGLEAPVPHTPTVLVGLRPPANYSNVATRSLLLENQEKLLGGKRGKGLEKNGQTSWEKHDKFFDES